MAHPKKGGSMRLTITYRAFNSGGKGGQHGNRSMNAIEASVELPDGTTLRATSKTCKSQHANKKLATAQLAAKVREYYRDEPDRGETAGFGAQGRIRTYHQPGDRVVDEAGPTFTWNHTVGKGDLSEVIDARRMELSHE